MTIVDSGSLFLDHPVPVDPLTDTTVWSEAKIRGSRNMRRNICRSNFRILV